MRYLLTGGAGTLGQELQKHLDCVAPSHSQLDITWPVQRMQNELWGQGIGSQHLDGIIHAAAYTNVPGAEREQNKAVEANIIGTRNIKSLAKCWDLRVVYISTDYVYPGCDGSYKEDSPTDPVNFYAFTKLAGESFMGPRDLIVRTSFKPNAPWPYPQAFGDLHTSADYVDVIAPKIVKLITHEASGIYNVGTERKTIYRLAKSRTYNVEAGSRKDVQGVRLPFDTSMSLEKYARWECENE